MHANNLNSPSIEPPKYSANILHCILCKCTRSRMTFWAYNVLMYCLKIYISPISSHHLGSRTAESRIENGKGKTCMKPQPASKPCSGHHAEPVFACQSRQTEGDAVSEVSNLYFIAISPENKSISHRVRREISCYQELEERC